MRSFAESWTPDVPAVLAGKDDGWLEERPAILVH